MKGFLHAHFSPHHQVIMKVDIIYEKNMLHLYLISSFGGLLVLLLIFWVLYKVRTVRVGVLLSFPGWEVRWSQGGEH